MGFLSKLIGEVVEGVVDTVDLTARTAADVVMSPIDLMDEAEGEDALFQRSRAKLEEMKSKDN